ncbi:MAG: hypothetical protein GY823_12425 [Flavobacteriaceae bacterium]|nr:hypothetical protein [Flavobacteriaceae bacterium]
MAANAAPINIVGMADIICSYDPEGQHKFTHMFYITQLGCGKLNLLGTDLINKQFKLWDFQDTSVTLKEHEKKVYLLKSAEKNYPYFAKIYSLKIQKDIHIPAQTARLIKIPKNQGMPFIKPNTHLNINQKMATTNLLFYEVCTTTKEDEFPIFTENNSEHTITLTKGEIGYLIHDVKSKVPRYKINNKDEFINKITSQYLNENNEDMEDSEDTESGTEDKITPGIEPGLNKKYR